VDCHDTWSGPILSRDAPVEEVDPVALPCLDDEPIRLERRVRLGDIGQRQVHEP
jgi:hypothetical protein